MDLLQCQPTKFGDKQQRIYGALHAPLPEDCQLETLQDGKHQVSTCCAASVRTSTSWPCEQATQRHVEASAAELHSGRHGLRRTRVENAKEKKRLMDFGGVCVSGASQSAAEPRKIFQLTSMYQPTTNICLRPLLPERER